MHEHNKNRPSEDKREIQKARKQRIKKRDKKEQIQV
jgi:hypothetical protein